MAPGVGLCDLIDGAVRAGELADARELSELFERLVWVSSDVVAVDLYEVDNPWDVAAWGRRD